MTFADYRQLLRYFIWRLRARILSAKQGIRIGRGTYIEPGVTIRIQGGGHVVIGENCWIMRGAQIITWGGDIVIGNNCSVNPYTVIYGQGGTKIGNGVRIATQCVIVPSNHIFSDKTVYIYKQGLSKQGIKIEDNVWLGAGVKVLDGVTIRFGTVIGANAVVNKSTDAHSVYVGIPAKKIKDI